MVGGSEEVGELWETALPNGFDEASVVVNAVVCEGVELVVCCKFEVTESNTALELSVE